MNIGFIGLGVMGRPMASHLIAAGHVVYLNRVRQVSSFLVEQGGIAADTPRAVASSADIVILMLPDTPDVETVLFGQDGVAEGLSNGKLVIDMSSISPVETRKFAKRIEAAGCQYVDAPVSGGEAGARSAGLTIMAGGTPEAVERAMPLFDILGKTITHIGPVGDGQVAKVANQIVVGLTIQAVAEALTLVERAGSDRSKVREALLGGLAKSTILDMHGRRMIDEAFAPGFRIQLHRKDIALATTTARQLGLALPGVGALEQLMNAAVGCGDGDLDHSALVKSIRAMAGLGEKAEPAS